MREYYRLILALAIAAFAGGVLAACSRSQVQPWETATSTPQTITTPAQPTLTSVATPEPLVPTLIPTAAAAITATAPVTTGQAATALPVPARANPRAVSMPTPAPTLVLAGASDLSSLEPGSLRSRLGVGVAKDVTKWTFDAALAQQLKMGWYLDWHTAEKPLDADGLEFAQMVRVHGRRYSPNRGQIVKVLSENPGALWLIGNEPDVPWQDNTTPEDYAHIYHELYTFIKALDPSAQVAIGGVSQVTPLRLSYLDRVLAEYERRYGRPMPVDVWNIHAFILREERNSWGVSIPPGFDDVKQGMLWEIDDHDDMQLLRQQIVDFRRWMDQHGQRNKPLIVTEYGILMPEGYGFPPEQVANYMIDSFDFLLNASDPELGLPSDGNRLVQRLAWYSLGDTTYPTGNLVDPETGELTPIGRTFADYAASLGESP